MKFTKKADPDKYSHSDMLLDHWINLNQVGSSFSINGEWGKNVSIFGVNYSLSVHIDDRKKDILFLSKGITDRLDDITITADVANTRKKITVYTTT